MKNFFLLTLFLFSSVKFHAYQTVVFKNTRTLDVEGVKYEGNQAILIFPGGGKMIVPLDMIENVYSIEIPPPTIPCSSEKHEIPPASGIPFGDIIEREAKAHALDWRLVAALIQVESGFKSEAVSPKGACGLMQLMPSIQKLYGVLNPFDPEENIRAGITHLSELIDHFNGKIDLALAAYNAGLGAVEKYGGLPPYRETKFYVKAILTIYNPED